MHQVQLYAIIFLLHALDETKIGDVQLALLFLPTNEDQRM